MTKHKFDLRLLLSTMFLAWLATATPAWADDDISETALNRAHAFFKTEQRAKSILSALHFAARYDGHTYKGYAKVKNGDGKIVPGHMALVYDYKWAGDGETRVAFLCDARGSFYELKVLKSNGELSRPFVLAKISIKLLGEAILAAFKDDLKEADRKQLRKLIDDADPKGLLEASLKLQQAFGR
jgi:hypothetical protein